jgi:uncharacterized repeat protein (TIGR01451 family)
VKPDGIRGLRLLLSALAVLASSLVGVVATASNAAAATPNCSFADAGSGAFAETLCWFDMSQYNASVATSAGGQPFTINLPNGYTLTFTLNVTGGAVAPAALPTYSAAFLGRNGYTGIAGDPSLYQTTSGTTTTATESNITMTDPGGNPVTDYSLVGADAESTDPGESISWTSSGPLTSLTANPSGNGIGNACGGGYSGVGTNTVTCIGSATGTKTGAAILASIAPTTFTQQMKGSGLEAFGFGVLVSGVELNKTVVGGFTGDSFGITATDGSGTVLGSDNTAGGTTASTGIITLITSTGGEQFTLAETATAGTLADYDGSWDCTRNGAPDASLPSGNAGASATVTLGIGDLVDCTITNTAQAATLSIVKHAGTPVDVNHDGLTDAGDTILYTFDVTNTGLIELDNVGVTDSKVGTVNCPQADLAAGAAETCTAASPYPISAADVSHGSVDNTATATGTVFGSAGTVTSPPSSTSTPTTTPNPGLTLVKSVLPTSAATAGQRMTYSFLITNSGNVTITGVGVQEVSFSGTGTPLTVSCPGGAPSLVPTASVTCTAPYDVTQADIDAGSVTNVADATGTDPASQAVVSATSSATFLTTADPSLTVVKSASPSGVLHAGELETYSFVVTNTGNVTLTGVTVDESSFSGSGTLSPVTCPPGAASLAPAAQVTCTATYTVTQADVDSGALSNSATAQGIPPGSVVAIPSPPSTVVLPQTPDPALSVLKSAAPTTISKVGQNVTYSFLVTNTGNVTLTDAAISDKDFTGSGALSAIDCPAAASSLVPAARVTCTATYVVTQHDLDAGSISNTATASGEDPAHAVILSPPSTAKVVSTAVNKLGLVKTGRPVDVNHDKVTDAGDKIIWSLVATNLGATTITDLSVLDPTAGTVTCPVTTLAPGASVTCRVSAHTITAADAAAGHVRNTARASGKVMGTAPINSVPARATVAVDQATPPNKTTLPFTGFSMTLPLTSGGGALVVLGVLMTAAAAIRRRSN